MGVSIQHLEQEIEKVRAELHQENQRGAIKDSHKVSELETKLSDLSQQLDVEQRLNQHETKVEESQTEIAYFMDTLNVDGITMRELCRNEEAYQLLRAVVQGYMHERDEKRLNELKDLELTSAGLKAEREQMQQRYDALYEESTNQRKEIHQLQVELEDAQNKHAAAVSEMEDYRKEVERLNGHVDDLRKEIAVGAVGAAKTVDVTQSLEQYKRKIKEEQESKIPVYDVEALDHKGSRFRGKRADNDQFIEYGWLEKGNFREVSPEEVPSFRRAYQESQRSHEDMAQPGETVEESTVTPIRTEGDSAEHGLDQVDANGEMETEATGSVEERLKALEQRVSALELQGKGEAA
jgi:soluble cytochrome b562